MPYKSVFAILCAAVGVCAVLVFFAPQQLGYRNVNVMVRAMLPSSTIPDRQKRFDRSLLLSALKGEGFALGDPVFVQIFKEESRLDVYVQGRNTDHYSLFRSYDICTYSGALGPKIKEGDQQAPEGFYAVGAHQLNPNSRHHLSFNIGFPNAYDVSLGRTGTFLMVHGGCSSVGCYAMTDEKVDEIYAMVSAAIEAGQPQIGVHIFPFELTQTRLAKETGQPWFDFWHNLKTGYDLFAQTGAPPVVGACGEQYVFNQDVKGDDGQGNACTPIDAWPSLPQT